jgi:hypothetical protein
MNQKSILKSQIEIADIHCDRLKAALTYIERLPTLTVQTIDKLSYDDLSYLDMLSTRFSKLQDVIGEKIFPSILEILEEKTEGLSTIDRLNKLEKLRFLDDVDVWRKMRSIRNSISHEYPDQPNVRLTQIEELIEQTKILLKYWEFLKGKIAQLC